MQMVVDQDVAVIRERLIDANEQRKQKLEDKQLIG